MGRRRVETSEIASFGFDEFLATIGGDPDRTPTNVGLRVPAFVPLDPATGNVLGYLFLGARADLDEGDRVIGYRTLAHLGFAQAVAGGAPPSVVLERPIETPGWRFPDGMIDMHLTTEPQAPARAQVGPVDQESFIFEDASTPALLYETATIPIVPPAPGYLGLNSYTPPPMRGKTEILTLRDVRTRWQRFSAFRYDIERPTTLRFYIRVVQSSLGDREGGPARRATVTLVGSDFSIEGLTKEDNFVQFFPNALYWRVGVSLLVERAEPPKPKPLRAVTPPPETPL